MTYQSVHTGPEVDAAVTVLDDVQEIRTEVEGYKNTVVSLAGQVQTDAGNAAADALTASQAASDALDSKNAAYASEQAASGHAANADSARAQAVVARNGAEDALGEALDAEGRMIQLLSDSGSTVDELRAAIRRINYGGGPYPSLDLNFVGATMLDPRVEFERSSDAWRWDERGLLVQEPANAPRFQYDPVTGKSLGLLVEGQATNLLLWSEDFTQWSYSRTAITQGSVVAPDGTPTGSKVESDGTAGAVYLRVNSDEAIVGQPYTVSVYAKRSELSEFQIQFRSISSSTPGVIFDLDGGTASVSSGALDDYGIEEVGGGWYRCYASLTAEVSDSLFAWLYLGIGVQGGNGIYIWGAQLEKGSRPTSYIPTEGSQVTRAADNVLMPTSEFPYNPLEGTILIKLEVRKGLVNNPNAWCASNSMNLRAEFGGTNLRLTLDLRSVGHSLTATGLYGKGGSNILAVSFRDGEILLGLNGNTAAIQIEGNIGPHIEGLNLGRRTTSNYINSTIDNFTFFPRAFSEAQLIALTS